MKPQTAKTLIISIIALVIVIAAVWLLMPYIKLFERLLKPHFLINLLIDFVLIIPTVKLASELIKNPTYNKYSNPNRNTKIVLLVIFAILTISQTMQVVYYLRYTKYLLRWDMIRYWW